ncbi:MAG: hypothetical protein EOP48_16290 [Sphingobacteriales bacterium]|nr:MAG: hypothetical protein EOP48_16290 [Sphingobacteriales bacterium]
MKVYISILMVICLGCKKHPAASEYSNDLQNLKKVISLTILPKRVQFEIDSAKVEREGVGLNDAPHGVRHLIAVMTYTKIDFDSIKESFADDEHQINLVFSRRAFKEWLPYNFKQKFIPVEDYGYTIEGQSFFPEEFRPGSKNGFVSLDVKSNQVYLFLEY